MKGHFGDDQGHGFPEGLRLFGLTGGLLMIVFVYLEELYIIFCMPFEYDVLVYCVNEVHTRACVELFSHCFANCK